jgi:Tfp pilus assembly protein FimV
VADATSPAVSEASELSEAAPPTVARTPAPGGTASAAPAPTVGEARPSDRAHTVRAGESLWSIANDLLGGQASPAQIAVEVQRLWQVNTQRIGTGNPNLLMIGTRLVLR